MRPSLRIATVLMALLVGCSERSVLVLPLIDCSMTDGYSVHLREGLGDPSATTQALRAKYRFLILDTYGSTNDAGGISGFLARMTPRAAHGVAEESTVAIVEPWTCQAPGPQVTGPVAQPPSLQ